MPKRNNGENYVLFFYTKFVGEDNKKGGEAIVLK